MKADPFPDHGDRREVRIRHHRDIQGFDRGILLSQYFAKMAEVVFKRSIHRLLFAFFAPSRELIGEDTNTVSREEREAAKRDWPKGRNVSTIRCEVRFPSAVISSFPYCTRPHCSVSGAETSEILSPGNVGIAVSGGGRSGRGAGSSAFLTVDAAPVPRLDRNPGPLLPGQGPFSASRSSSTTFQTASRSIPK